MSAERNKGVERHTAKRLDKVALQQSTFRGGKWSLPSKSSTSLMRGVQQQRGCCQ